MSRFDPTEIWGPPSSHETTHSPSESSDFDFFSGDSDFLWDSDAPTEGAYDDVGPFSQNPSSRVAFFLPTHYEAKYEYPLLVWLHSDGFNENQIKQVLPHISLRNYVAVGTRASRAVDSSGHCYEWRKSPAAIASANENVLMAIDEAQSRFSINPSRVVLAGYQNGGTMAMRIALQSPNRFAGVVSLGGALPQGCHSLSNLDLLRERRLQMLWQWAHKNPAYSSNRLDHDMRTALMIRAKLEVRKYDDDDEMNTVALADMNQWIMNSVIPASQNQSNDAWSTSPTQFSHN
ncbi:alpha/beta hydrolase [Novipirellula herctigrandis]